MKALSIFLCSFLMLGPAFTPTYAQNAAPPPTPIATHHISGTIHNEKGDAIEGAHLKLTGSNQQIISEQTTSDIGLYTLDIASGGDYTLTITAHAFLPVTYPFHIPDQPGTATADITLKLAPVEDSVTVNASREDIAEAQIALQEQQRLIGVFPNFFVSYEWRAESLTAKQKFHLALRNAADPGNLILVGVTAGFQQSTNAFPGYGQGAAGYGRRFGADFGNLVSGTFMGGAVLPSLFHQDPRYFYKGTGSTSSRFWYAVTRAIITRSDKGKSQPNWSSILGDMSAGAISNLYYAPEDRNGVRLTLANGLLGIGGDALNGLFQEFVLPRFTSRSRHPSQSAP